MPLGRASTPPRFIVCGFDRPETPGSRVKSGVRSKEVDPAPKTQPPDRRKFPLLKSPVSFGTLLAHAHGQADVMFDRQEVVQLRPVRPRFAADVLVEHERTVNEGQFMIVDV